MVTRHLNIKLIKKRVLISLSRRNLDRAVAYLLYLYTETLKKGRPSNGPVKRILLLNWGKDGVLEDVEYVFRHDDTFEIITWPNFALQVMASAFLDPNLDHNKYVTTDPAMEATKARYRNFLANMWSRFVAITPVSAVLSVNFGYYQQREFATVVEQQGTPFIVLQKENYNGVPPLVDFWRKIYSEGRGKFTGRKILVYNDIERQLQISSGIASPESVVVTGMPRVDAIHGWRCEHAGQSLSDPERPQVLFFTFAPKHKIPRVVVDEKSFAFDPRSDETAQALKRLDEEWEGRNWAELCAGTHKAILEFARTRPDVQVVVKSKWHPDQQAAAKKLIGDYGISLPNLKIINGGDPFKLMTESSVVVGFNTTGLLEALAAGKPVVVPRFAEALKKEMQAIVLDLGSAVDEADSPEELIDLISKNLARPRKVPLSLPAQSAKALKQYMGNDDGEAGKRVLDAISAEIRSG